MAIITWSNALSTGITEQDEQHKNLIYLINGLDKAVRAGKDQEIVLTELVDYTIRHFGYEEMLMDQFGYADTPVHKAEHEKFIEAVNDYKRKLRSGHEIISIQIINFMRMWITGHIMKTDKKMGLELAGLVASVSGNAASL